MEVTPMARIPDGEVAAMDARGSVDTDVSRTRLLFPRRIEELAANAGSVEQLIAMLTTVLDCSIADSIFCGGKWA